MGGPDRLASAALATLVALALTGCASSRKEPREALPPRAVTTVRPEPPPPSEPPVAIPTPPSVIVLDEGGDGEARPESLAEASARARAERSGGTPKPAVVITDKNLAEFVKDQKLTVASPSSETAVDSVDPVIAGGMNESEWRRRGLEIRQRWKDAVEAVARLEGETAALRTKFYSTDDPYLRDTQVKPEWDRALAELEEARRQSDLGPQEVETFLEEGRRAGALPGWLREGVELEPVPVLPTVDGTDAVEPVVSDEPPGP